MGGDVRLLAATCASFSIRCPAGGLPCTWTLPCTARVLTHPCLLISSSPHSAFTLLCFPCAFPAFCAVVCRHQRGLQLPRRSRGGSQRAGLPSLWWRRRPAPTARRRHRGAPRVLTTLARPCRCWRAPSRGSWRSRGSRSRRRRPRPRCTRKTARRRRSRRGRFLPTPQTVTATSASTHTALAAIPPPAPAVPAVGTAAAGDEALDCSLPSVSSLDES